MAGRLLQRGWLNPPNMLAALLPALLLLPALPPLAPPPPPPPRAPDKFSVVIDTDVKGAEPITVAIDRVEAPLGVDRLYALLGVNFFDNSAFYRFVPPNSSGCVHICGGVVRSASLPRMNT